MNCPDAAPPPGEAAPGSIEGRIAEEHAAIGGHLAHLRDLATGLEDLDETAARQRTAAVLDFLTHELLPHADAEEASLYPAIESVLGAGATRTMSLDHRVIAGLTRELGVTGRSELGAKERAEAHRLLLVLEALIAAHLWKEDTAYVPLLALLDPTAYARLHADLAAHPAHQRHTPATELT
ncbi:MAG: hemerythrin domain-containing protein [Candidatus Dormibacteria bacterium]